MPMYFTTDGKLIVEREINGKIVTVEGPGAYLKLCRIQDEMNAQELNDK